MASFPTGKTALLLGATGQTGQKILHELLQSSDFARVGEYGRRLTDKSTLPETGIEKLVQRTIDFEKLEESGLKENKWDVVFIALGTTRKIAGSAEAFEKIDREYVVNAAREAKSGSPDQRLVYSMGADASSSFLYPRSKGLTENALAALGYNDTIIFRPGFLADTNRGPKQEFLVSLISTLAKSVVAAGAFGSTGLPVCAQATKVGNSNASFTLIKNPGALALAEKAQ
ncbi:hypothetical protein H0H87_005731 [Tephrocybe sp. NHM501043]|nr:hypothetical protein H0H87_005731 [Tephrocybe sp. NHM501043]